MAALLVASFAGCDAPPPPLPTQEWSVREVLRIDAAREDLIPFMEIALGPSGSVAIEQERDRRVILFDSTGKRTAVVGRPGSGPGEFHSISTLGWIGDTLWVYDSNKRTTFFLSDGTLARTFVLEVPRWNVGDSTILLSTHRLRAIMPGGGMLVNALPWAESLACPCVVVSSEAGEVINFVSRRPPDYDVMVEYRAGGSTVPFAWGEPGDHSPSGELLGTVLASTAERDRGEYRVVLVGSSGDTVFSRTYGGEMIKIETAAIDAALEDRLSRGVPASVVAELRPGIYPMYAPYTGIRIGLDSTVWIQLRQVDGRTPWLVLDPSGTPIGRLTLPGNALLVEADRRRLWTAMEDDDGLTSLVVLEVVR